MANCTFDPYIIVNWTNVYPWYYNNGSTFYCNQDFNWQCNATFSGDSDIGGYGVMISFVATAGITTLLAAISAFTPMVTHGDSLKSWWSAELPSHVTFEPDLTKISGLRYWLHEFSTATLPALCDLQLITGTGIMVSGLIQVNTISMYHRFLVNSYWYLTFNSLWSAAVFVTTTHARSQSSRGTRSRFMIIPMWILDRTHLQAIFSLATVALAIYSLSRTIIDEGTRWDPFSSGTCYRLDTTPFPINEWVWISGLYFFEIGVLFSLHPRTSGWVNKIDNALKTTERRLIMTCRSLRENWFDEDLPFYHWTSGLLEPALQIEMTCAIIVLWTFRQVLSLFALGSGTQVVSSFFYVIFYAMNAAYTVRAKIINRELVEDETSWGFGQILPLILMLSIILLAVDAIEVANKNLHKKRLIDVQLEPNSELTYGDDGVKPPMIIYARPFFGLPLYRAAREAELAANMIVLPESYLK